MLIESAKFTISAASLKDCPKGDLPEYAFIGRSNVGKSSLINTLLQRNELARTSSTPGKTITMNYFLINEDWYVVDLPGYGYAKRSKTLRSAWEKSLWQYLNSRENLVNLFVLIDSRIPPQEKDLDFINQLGEAGVPFSIVYTKLDKLKAIEAEENIKQFEAKLLENWEELPHSFQTSSVSKLGKEEMLKFIVKHSKNWYQDLQRKL
jgi:GTP-binding protein